MLSEYQIQRRLFDVIGDIERMQREAIQLKYKLDDALAEKAKLEEELARIRGYVDDSSVISQQMTLDLLKSEVGDIC